MYLAGVIVSSNILHEQNHKNLGFLVYAMCDHAPEVRHLPICIAVYKSTNLPNGPVDKLLFLPAPLVPHFLSIRHLISHSPACMCGIHPWHFYVSACLGASVYLRDHNCIRVCVSLCVRAHVCVCLPPQGKAPDGLKTTNNLPDPLIILSDSISS